jgi:hypothetical protein
MAAESVQQRKADHNKPPNTIVSELRANFNQSDPGGCRTNTSSTGGYWCHLAGCLLLQ